MEIILSGLFTITIPKLIRFCLPTGILIMSVESARSKKNSAQKSGFTKRMLRCSKIPLKISLFSWRVVGCPSIQTNFFKKVSPSNSELADLKFFILPVTLPGESVLSEIILCLWAIHFFEAVWGEAILPMPPEHN